MDTVHGKRHHILRFAISFLFHSLTVMRLRISKHAKSLRHKKPKSIVFCTWQVLACKLAPVHRAQGEADHPDWQVAGFISKGTYWCGLSWALQDEYISTPAHQNLRSLRSGLYGVLWCIPSTWSQHLPLSHLCPWNSYPCGNSGLNIHSKDGEGVRGLWLPRSSLQVNRRSCPLNDLLQKQGKQPKTYFLCFDWGLKHHALAFNKPSELVKIGPWAYVLVDLTVVFHGNQRVRDQIASEVISRLISRSILHEQMYTYQNKTFKQQICVPSTKSA